MKLAELFEARSHRKDISVEQAVELIKTNCKDMDPTKPFWRGSYMEEDAYLIQGELGERSSANTTNHYTVIMDHFLPALGFPRRSKSIIFTTSRSYAADYGNLYVIFPYDGVPIGVVNALDIWHLTLAIGDENRLTSHKRKIEAWNNFFDMRDIPDYSYQDLVQGIKDTLENPEDRYYRDFEAIFEKPENVEKFLEQAYTPPNLDVSVNTSKQAQRLTGEHELWMSGKCVAIREKTWHKL